jgi:hypothetical protein
MRPDLSAEGSPYGQGISRGDDHGGVTLMHSNDSVPTLAQLSDAQRAQAMVRFAVLRPHLEDGVSLPRAAVAAGVAVRTAERWLARYRLGGLVGLARAPRTDVGQRKVDAKIVAAIEGLYLRKPQPSVAAAEALSKISPILLVRNRPD